MLLPHPHNPRRPLPLRLRLKIIPNIPTHHPHYVPQHCVENNEETHILNHHQRCDQIPLWPFLRYSGTFFGHARNIWGSSRSTLGHYRVLFWRSWGYLQTFVMYLGVLFVQTCILCKTTSNSATLSCSWASLGALLAALGAQLAALGSLLAALGSLLGFLGLLLVSLGLLLGRSWHLLGRSWLLLGASLDALGCYWAALGRSWTALVAPQIMSKRFCSNNI